MPEKKDILNNFSRFRELEILMEKLYKIKIDNPDDFIDLAEEFKSNYESLNNIDFFKEKFQKFYEELIKKLEELQNKKLKISIQAEKIKYQIQNALKKGPINNINYNSKIKEEN